MRWGTIDSQKVTIDPAQGHNENLKNYPNVRATSCHDAAVFHRMLYPNAVLTARNGVPSCFLLACTCMTMFKRAMLRPVEIKYSLNRSH